MLRVIKFVIDTKNLGIKVAPTLLINNEWIIVGFSDSDFGGDKETRISVAGFIIYLMGVPISWKSKGQKTVALSSSEAEYVALSEAVKEVRQVQEFMEPPIRVGAVYVFEDNEGAIKLAVNIMLAVGRSTLTWNIIW